MLDFVYLCVVTSCSCGCLVFCQCLLFALNVVLAGAIVFVGCFGLFCFSLRCLVVFVVLLVDVFIADCFASFVVDFVLLCGLTLVVVVVICFRCFTVWV